MLSVFCVPQLWSVTCDHRIISSIHMISLLDQESVPYWWESRGSNLTNPHKTFFLFFFSVFADDAESAESETCCWANLIR